MTVALKTWPYGTQRKGVVLRRFSSGLLVVTDELNEGHLLIGTESDPTAIAGDHGTLTFTEGGPTGGYWKFRKD